ncbi:hypothetical protein [Methanomethylophilus alvi]|uniref:hypothetical protein n=1 Tax=Methanomethylophilus alvi TaxID=1291540 RepID=UPI0037DD6D97
MTRVIHCSKSIYTGRRLKAARILVPIIALMLCAVAVIGAGYAYQSSVSVQNNTVEGGSLVVETNTSLFLKDEAPDVIFTQDKVYDKDGSYKVSIKAAGAGAAITDSSGASVDMTIGEGASASLLGSATVTITNNSGKDVTTLTAKVTISGDPSIGEKKLSDIVQEFLIVVSPTVKASVLDKTESADILETNVADGDSRDVTCNIYVVIKDTTVVNESNSATMSALTTALDEAKLTVEFVASGN